MNMNGISNSSRKDGAITCVAQYVRILLVDDDTSSLISLASEFHQKLYQVTTTKSATIALSLFQMQKSEYDVVIVDTRMLEMGISEFVHKLNGQDMTIPIILIAENLEKNLTKEALASGVCYVFSKTPNHHDIANLWQHIPRVTGKMPALFDMTHNINIKKDGDHCSDNSIGGAARSKKRKNLETKRINVDKENMKRKKKQISENSNFLNDTEEEDDRNSNKKSRLTWTSYLHEKFLHAVNILGKHEARPKSILRLMNEPNLTIRHIASHLQKFKQQTRHSLNLQKPASPVIPDVLGAVPPSIFAQVQTAGMVHSNYTESCGTPQIPNSPNQESIGANGHMSNGLEAPNQEPIDDFEALLYDFENVDNIGNMNNDNFGEGSSAYDQYSDGMAGSDDINIIQELETSDFNIWDLIN